MTTTAKTIHYQSRNIYLSELSDALSDFHFTVSVDIPRWDIKAGKRYHVRYDKELGYWFRVDIGFLSPDRIYLSDMDQESLNQLNIEA
jgi:hypothetical protein